MWCSLYFDDRIPTNFAYSLLGQMWQIEAVHLRHFMEAYDKKISFCACNETANTVAFRIGKGIEKTPHRID